MTSRGQLCVVVCGAGVAANVTRLVTLAMSAGWTVRVAPTPTAVDFLDVATLADQTGRPVLSAFRSPGQPRISGTDDAIIVAAATFNSINKLAAGICDTYALAVVGEAIGAGVPVVVLPAVNAALAARLPYRNAVASLRSEGVAFLTDHDAESYELALRTLDSMDSHRD